MSMLRRQNDRRSLSRPVVRHRQSVREGLERTSNGWTTCGLTVRVAYSSVMSAPEGTTTVPTSVGVPLASRTFRRASHIVNRCNVIRPSWSRI